MSIFGSPPLKPNVGRERTTYYGVAVAPSDNFVQVETSAEKAPNGLPIVLYKNKSKKLYEPGSFAMDASGQWWAGIGSSAIKTDEPGGGGILDIIQNAVIHYVLPGLSAVIGATVAGPAGFAAATLLTTWGYLAKGSDLKASLGETLRQTPSIVDHSIIEQTYNSIVTKKLSVADLEKLRAMIPKDNDSQKAFNTGVALGKGQQTQDLLFDDIEAHLPLDRKEGFRQAMLAGGFAKDYIAANFGTMGTAKLEAMTSTAAAKVEAAPTGGSSGSGGGSSSSPGIGTLVLVGAGGYALYKFWPKIMTHFSHPGQRSR